MIDVKARRPNGKIVRIRRVSPDQTKRGATRYELQVRRAIAAGEDVDAKAGATAKAEPAPTLAAWAEIFVRDYSQAKGLRPSTIGEQRGAFRLYLIPTLGASTPIDAIRTPHFDQVRRGMMGQGYAPKTVNNALAVLSRAMGFFYERQGLDVPRFDSCRVKVPKSPPKFWTPDELERLLAAAGELGGETLGAMLLMADCGLRTGEVLALEWKHISWRPSPVIVVQRSYTRRNFGPPKGGKHRTVPMTARTVEALRALPRALNSPWVFTRHESSGPSHYTRSALTWLVVLAERAVGLAPKDKKDGQLHKLRHTYVTRLAAAGVPPRTIMELAGHEHLSTSLRYMHLLPGAGAQAVAALESFDASEAEREDNQGHHRGTA